MLIRFKNQAVSSRSRAKRWALLCPASVIGFSSVAWGVTPTYVGPDNGSFGTPGDWSTGIAPNSGDDVYVGPDEGAASSMNVEFDYGASNYTSGGFNSLNIDSPSSSQTVTVTESPSLGHFDSLQTTNATIGMQNNGKFVQGGLGGSTNTITGNLTIGLEAMDMVGNGEYDLIGSDATLSVGGELDLAVLGDIGSFKPATGIFMQSAGLMSANTVQMGSALGNPEYILSGGTLTTQALLLNAAIGNGTFTQTGGSVIVGTPSASGKMQLFEGENEYTMSSASGASSLTVYGDLSCIGNLGSSRFSESAGIVTVTGDMLAYTENTSYSLISGNLSFSDSATCNVNGGLYIGGSSTDANQVGNFQQSGGSVTITGAMKIWNTTQGPPASATLSGGTLTIGSLDTSGTPSLFTWTNGTLHVTNQQLDFNSPTDTNAPLGNSLTLASGQTLSVDLGESLNGMGANVTQNTGSTDTTQSLYIGNNTLGEYDVRGGILTAGNVSIGLGSGTGVLQVLGGSVQINNSLSIVAPGSEVLQLAGSITAATTTNNVLFDQSAGTASLGALSGTGTLDLGTDSSIATTTATASVSSITQSSVILSRTSKLTILHNSASVTNTIDSLSIDGNGTLDLTNNHLFIDYAAYGFGADPVSLIRAYLVSGYASGAWNGPGIDSSTAAVNSHYGIGYADGADHVVAGLSSGQIEIKYTLLGDADLDGAVTGSDFTILASNLGNAVSSWDKGDFDYDGVVSGSDFTALVENLGKSASGADITLPTSDYTAIDAFAAANGLMADVPEPTAASIIVAVASGLMVRRRRRPRS
jgi:hypothetical protein